MALWVKRWTLHGCRYRRVKHGVAGRPALGENHERPETLWFQAF